MAYGGMPVRLSLTHGYGTKPGKVTKVEDADFVVDTVATLLKACSFVVTNQVVKGGSLGHGTTVPGYFDADLVLYSTSITKKVMLTKGYQSGSAIWWAQRLDNYLRSKMPGYERMSTGEHGVQFKVTLQDGMTVKCDLLMSPQWEDQEELLKYFRAQAARDNLQETLKTFSASASLWQVRFIKSVPNEVKELIKRAKKWRNDQWCSDEPDIGKPKSYLISVLVIHACLHYATQKSYHSLASLVNNEHFSTIATSVDLIIKGYVKKHHTLQLTWLRFRLPPEQLNLELLRKHQDAAVSAPYIPDPANPYNNLYITGVGPYDPRRHFRQYGKGNGKWVPFVHNVGSLDLTKAIQ